MQIQKIILTPDLELTKCCDVHYRNSLLEQVLLQYEIPVEDVRILAFSREIPPGKMTEILDNPSNKWENLLCTGALNRDGAVIQTRSEKLMEVSRELLAGKRPEPNARIGYGSVFMTPCFRGIATAITVKVAIVEDEFDHRFDTQRAPFGVGDCSGKLSLRFIRSLMALGMVDRDDQAIQFRIRGISVPFLAKGMMAPDVVLDTPYFSNGIARNIDIVIPMSAIKGGIVSPGIQEMTIDFGVHKLSTPGRTRVGDQWLRPFSTDVKIAAFGESVTRSCSELRLASKSVVDTLMYLHKDLLSQDSIDDDDDNEDLDSYQSRDPWDEMVKFLVNPPPDRAAIRDRLLSHPYVVFRCKMSLRKYWRHLTMGAGLYGKTYTAMPDDSLPLGYVESVHFHGCGECLPYRCPTQDHSEQEVWHYNHRPDGLHGCAYMSHATAAMCSGDFDGRRSCRLEK